MRKLIILLLLISAAASAQQKALVTFPYVFLIDTTTKTLEYHERGQSQNKYSLYVKSGHVKLFDCYDGGLFVFVDTISISDFAQQGSTGIYKYTPHASPLSTSKRNAYLNNTILQYDTATHEIVLSPFSDSNYPIVIRNKNTLVRHVVINSPTLFILEKLPTLTNISNFGIGVKKIIIN